MDVAITKIYQEKKAALVKTNSNFFIKQLLLGGILPLGFASTIYFVFRSETLIVFDLFKRIHFFNFIESIRNHSLFSTIILPKWFLYALPDGLYLFSFTTLMMLLWGNKISGSQKFWIFSIPMMAITSEVLQSFGWFPGTYDTADLICYIIGFILPFFLFDQKENTKTRVAETKLISITLIIFYLFMAVVAGDQTILQFLFGW